MNASDRRPVVITAEGGGAVTLTSDLAELVGESDADVSFANFESSPGSNRGIADFATTIATLGPVVSAVGALLQAVINFATSRGSRTIEITGADGATFKIPTSVSPGDLAGYVEQFQRVTGVRIHVDPPGSSS